MSAALIGVLNLSLSGGCVALLVIVLRLLLKKAPKVYAYALWAVVFFRLVCPLTIPLPISAVPVRAQTIPQDIIYVQSPAIESGLSALDSAVNGAMERSLPPVSHENSINPLQALLEGAAWVWLAVALGLMLYGAVSYWRLKRRVRTAVRVGEGLYETEFTQTPFVLGLLRPRIYLPLGLSGGELDYVIAHERTHIRRLDYLLKPLAFLVVCVHWFNPLAWISYTLLARDMELSADESVLKRMDGDIRGAYSASLLALSTSKIGLFSPLAFGEMGVKSRVKNILNYRQPAFWVSLAAIVAVVVAAVLLLSGEGAPAPAVTPPVTPAPAPAVSQPAPSPPATPQSWYDRATLTLHGDDGETALEITDQVVVDTLHAGTLDSGLGMAEWDRTGNNIKEYQIQLYRGSTGSSSDILYYDRLYDRACMGAKDPYEVPVDFARYVDSLFANSAIDPNIAHTDAAALFREYGWTLDYRIATLDEKLNDFTALSAFDPNAYYYAYHNELSKDIGLDLSGHVGSGGLTAEIYHVYEPMPKEFYPIENARGVVLRKDGAIIGAFLSAGRHRTFAACSLKGNSFETVTGQTVDAWLETRLTPDERDSALAALTPEQVAAEYFDALNQKDERRALSCLARVELLNRLTMNMPDDELYNEGIVLPMTVPEPAAKTPFDNLKSAELVSVEPMEETDANHKTLRVTVDLQYREARSIDSGEQWWGCHMVYESPQTGWKIVEFGH